MRSLKNLIKPLVNRNTGIIDLQYNVDLTINDFYPIINSIGGTNSVLRMIGLPSSPIGLTEGGVWRDENGFLRIV